MDDDLMARGWICDRCKQFSNGGDVDDPPALWVNYTMPVRGSQGARSTGSGTLCDSCYNSLYEWLYEWLHEETR